MIDGIQLRVGFKSRDQLPWLMVWKEEWKDNELVHAWVVFNSLDWIGR